MPSPTDLQRTTPLTRRAPSVPFTTSRFVYPDSSDRRGRGSTASTSKLRQPPRTPRTSSQYATSPTRHDENNGRTGAASAISRQQMPVAGTRDEDDIWTDDRILPGAGGAHRKPTVVGHGGRPAPRFNPAIAQGLGSPEEVIDSGYADVSSVVDDGFAHEADPETSTQIKPRNDLWTFPTADNLEATALNLKNDEWLTASDIQACLLTLPPSEGWHITYPGYPKMAGDFKTVEPFHAKETSSPHIVFILNPSRVHWVVGHWDRNDKTFTVYDPMKGVSNFNRVMEFMADWLADDSVKFVNGVSYSSQDVFEVSALTKCRIVRDRKTSSTVASSASPLCRLSCKERPSVARSIPVRFGLSTRMRFPRQVKERCLTKHPATTTRATTMR